jgi:hypothetical protein
LLIDEVKVRISGREYCTDQPVVVDGLLRLSFDHRDQVGRSFIT